MQESKFLLVRGNSFKRKLYIFNVEIDSSNFLELERSSSPSEKPFIKLYLLTIGSALPKNKVVVFTLSSLSTVNSNFFLSKKLPVNFALINFLIVKK